MGVTGTPGANILAREADLIIGIGTRYTDFTTASQDRFSESCRPLHQHQRQRIRCRQAVRARADRRCPRHARRAAQRAVGGFRRRSTYSRRKIAACARLGKRKSIGSTALRQRSTDHSGRSDRRRESISPKPSDIMVCAAGSMPGDLHKLWRTREPGGYHMEYGYSCMGYEIAGGLGVKMAPPDREVYVLVGDGSYLMMAQEIVTSLQEGYKLNIVLLDNHGFSSIGGLSRSLRQRGMGTDIAIDETESYEGDTIAVDFRANAASLGAWAVRARHAGRSSRRAARRGRSESRTSVIVIETAYRPTRSRIRIVVGRARSPKFPKSMTVKAARAEIRRRTQERTLFLLGTTRTQASRTSVDTNQATETGAEPHLKRVLSLWDLVYYGIILTSPIAAVPLFGEAQVLSRGHAVTTLLLGDGRDVGYSRQFRPHGQRLSFVGLGLLLHQQGAESARRIHSRLGDVSRISFPAHSKRAVRRAHHPADGAACSVRISGGGHSGLHHVMTVQGIKFTARTNRSCCSDSWCW